MGGCTCIERWLTRPRGAVRTSLRLTRQRDLPWAVMREGLAPEKIRGTYRLGRGAPGARRWTRRRGSMHDCKFLRPLLASLLRASSTSPLHSFNCRARSHYKGTSSMSALCLLSSSSSTLALRGCDCDEGPSSVPPTSLVPAGSCFGFSTGFSSSRAFVAAAGTASSCCLGGGVGGTSGPGSPTTGLSVTGLLGVPLLGRFD